MPLFNEAFYLDANPDVRAALEEGLIPSAQWHFENFGWQEGRNPSPFFDVDFYLEQNPDVAEAGVNPLEHFLEFGAQEGRNPSANFDVGFYLEQNPDVAEAGVNPLEHFLEFGAQEGRSPNPDFVSFDDFDTEAYLEANPDLAEAGITSPEALYGHFATFGFAENRSGASTKDGQDVVEGIVVQDPDEEEEPDDPDVLDPDDPDDLDDDDVDAPAPGVGGGAPTAPTTFEATLSEAGQLSFSGTATGAIALDVDPSGIVTASRAEVTAELTPNLIDIKGIELVGAEVILDGKADLDLFDAGQTPGVLSAGPVLRTVMIGDKEYYFPAKLEDLGEEAVFVLKNGSDAFVGGDGSELKPGFGLFTKESINSVTSAETLTIDATAPEGVMIYGVTLGDGDGSDVLNIRDKTESAFNLAVEKIEVREGSSAYSNIFLDKTFLDAKIHLDNGKTVTLIDLIALDADASPGVSVRAAIEDDIAIENLTADFQEVYNPMAFLGLVGGNLQFPDIVVKDGGKIQDAIDDADPGDTIFVEAGEYDEVITLDKPGLTILGPNAGIAGRDDDARGPEALVTGAGTNATFRVTAADVTIDGFTIAKTANSTTPPISVNGENATFSNNIINAATYQKASGLTFENNLVGNFLFGEGFTADGYSRNAVNSDGSQTFKDSAFIDNVFVNVERGLLFASVNGGYENLEIEGNVFDSIAQRSIQFGNAHTIDGVTIRGNTLKDGQTGIAVFNPVSPVDGLVIENNNFADLLIGVWINSPAAADVFVNQETNSFTDVAQAVRFQGPIPELDLEKVFGEETVDFNAVTFAFNEGSDNYVITKDSASVTVVGINKLAFSDETVLIVGEGGFDTIQDALEAAAVGDTIFVAAGEYDESVTIDKDSITLKTVDGARIDGPVRLEANGVTIDGFSLEGDGSGRGLQIVSGDDISVQNMSISSFLTGASLDFAGGPPENVTFTNNTFANNTAGIGSTENVKGLEINGNTFTDNDEGIGLGAGVILVDDQGIGNLVANNTFIGNTVGIGDYREGLPPLAYVIGGEGADDIDFSDGKNVIVYQQPSDSSYSSFDSITDFNATNDKIDISAFSLAGGTSAVLEGVPNLVIGQFANGITGIFSSNSTVFFEAEDSTFVLFDINSDGNFSPGDDMVVELVGTSLGLTEDNFIF